MKGSIDICMRLAGHAKKTWYIKEEKENNNMSFLKTHFEHFPSFSVLHERRRA